MKKIKLAIITGLATVSFLGCNAQQNDHKSDANVAASPQHYNPIGIVEEKCESVVKMNSNGMYHMSYKGSGHFEEFLVQPLNQAREEDDSKILPSPIARYNMKGWATAEGINRNEPQPCQGDICTKPALVDQGDVTEGTTQPITVRPGLSWYTKSEKGFYVQLNTSYQPKEKDRFNGILSLSAKAAGQKGDLCIKGLSFGVSLSGADRERAGSLSGQIVIATSKKKIVLDTQGVIVKPPQNNNTCKYKDCKIDKLTMALLQESAKKGSILIEVHFKHLVGIAEKNEVHAEDAVAVILEEEVQTDEEISKLEVEDRYLPREKRSSVLMKANTSILLRLLRSGLVRHIDFARDITYAKTN